MKTKVCCSVLLIAGLGLWPADSLRAQNVTFDFDTSVPVLIPGQGTPFDQTSGGITAHFSSPTPASGPVFSIQSDATTLWMLRMFSGNYVFQNNSGTAVLRVQFGVPLTAISVGFATGDLDFEAPSNIQLTAYLDTTQSTAVGTVTTHGTNATPAGHATWPMGTLSLDTAGHPFNLVEVTVPPQPQAGPPFFVDNIVVTRTAAVPAIATVSGASYAAAGVAVGSIVSGFGTALAAATAVAPGEPLPTTLANTVVTVKDSAGGERAAPLYYVSPTQINYVVPDNSALGAATVTVTSAGQVTAMGTMTIEPLAPALFTANQNGTGAAAARAITVAPDLTQTVQAVFTCSAGPGTCATSPIDLSGTGVRVVLELYGTGIRGRSSQAGVTATIGGVDAPVEYAGAQPVNSGLDQVNVAVPASLAGRGQVDLVLTVDGKAANGVTVNVK